MTRIESSLFFLSRSSVQFQMHIGEWNPLLPVLYWIVRREEKK